MPIEIFHCFLNYIPEHDFLISLRNHAEPQGKDICSNCIVAIIPQFRMKVFWIKSFFNQFTLFPKIFSILRITGQRCKPYHQIGQIIIKGCSQHRSFRDTWRIFRVDQFGRFGRHTPVSKIIFRHNMIYHILIFHITHPLLHRRIMFDDGLFIAKLIIKHICYD